MNYLVDDLLHSDRAADPIANIYYGNAAATRVNTNAFLVASLRNQYPNLSLKVIPISQGAGSCDLIAYASSHNEASVTPAPNEKDLELKLRMFSAAAKRADTTPGTISDTVLFGKYTVEWRGINFLVYVADIRDGTFMANVNKYQYVLGDKEDNIDSLMQATMLDQLALHEEIWVFDSSIWQKNKDLFQSVMAGGWNKVILKADDKKALRNDVLRFFKSKDKYASFKVPWKRGLIYYGPPGNGKTISIKAMMKELYQLKESIPSLYVRSLKSLAGTEYSIRSVFAKARQTAPCLLVFEDLDSFVTDDVKSYFFNEIDGLQANDGVLIVGTTNHLDRLDPGISKRPSRFDRKFDFPLPDTELRTRYCEFWRQKLAPNKDIKFPAKLSPKIAFITKNFSFAYLQEVFVASLLAIAFRQGDDQEQLCMDLINGDDFGDLVHVSAQDGADSGHDDIDEAKDDDDIENLVLWKEIQKQVTILKGET